MGTPVGLASCRYWHRCIFIHPSATGAAISQCSAMQRRTPRARPGCSACVWLQCTAMCMLCYARCASPPCLHGARHLGCPAGLALVPQQAALGLQQRLFQYNHLGSQGLHGRQGRQGRAGRMLVSAAGRGTISGARQPGGQSSFNAMQVPAATKGTGQRTRSFPSHPAIQPHHPPTHPPTQPPPTHPPTPPTFERSCSS